ncbi:MAG: hypothetical protein IPO83_07525 [Chitinophagaceae bacterium]|nr:hypothetical protein [Chitinophagaceae bacterium]
MIRSDNGIFADGNTGHFAFVVGKVGGGWNMKTLLPNPISYAQLGGNQAVPGSSSGTTVNVVLRGPASNVKYYHYTFLPKVSLMGSLFPTATTEAQQQLGTDR